MTARPLDGMAVVDLSSGIPGSYCTKVLVDGGADVVKIEPPNGDPLRQWSPGRALAEGQDGALFEFLACSKQSVVVDPADPPGLRAVEQLMAAADVIVWSRGSAVAELESHHPRALVERFPAALVAAITPFGLDGPWATRAWSELTLQAWAGAATLGSHENPPAKWGGRLGLWLGGIFAAVGILAARQRQAVCGRGELVEVSLLESIGFCVGNYPLTRKTMTPPDRLATIAAGPNRTILIPMIERTREGWVGFMVATAPMWESFCVMIEQPEWLEDPSLYAYAGRAARRDELEAAIRSWVSSRTTEEVLELAQLLRVPAAPIGTGATVTGFDHFVERRFYVENPRHGFLQPDVPYTLSGAAVERRPVEPAPRLGEHTRQVLSGRHRTQPAPGPSPRPELPLAGVRVADFTAFWAGPVVGSFLAMLGADVIHVESPKHPDGIRGHSVKAVADDRWWEWSPNFHGANTNKRAVTIDMSTETGRALARQLIARCDVMLENYSPRVMDHWGLDYDAVRTIRPDIVFVRMPAFGLSGPWRERTGYAQTMEQVSGIAWVTGFPDGPPQVLAGTCDPLAGSHATAALLLALEHRRKTGQGMQVEVAMVGGALNVTAEQVVEYQTSGHLMTRQGNRGTGAPQNLYLTNDVDETGRRDRWVAIAIEDDQQWQALRVALGEPDWAADRRLESADGRRRAHDEIDKRIAEWCLARSADEVVDTLWPAGVPVGKVVPASDGDTVPQYWARGFIERVPHPLTGEQLHIGYPVAFHAGPDRVHRSPAPTLGQHNVDVFVGLLGLTPQELNELEAMGVIGTRLLGEHRTR